MPALSSRLRTLTHALHRAVLVLLPALLSFVAMADGDNGTAGTSGAQSGSEQFSEGAELWVKALLKSHPDAQVQREQDDANEETDAAWEQFKIDEEKIQKAILNEFSGRNPGGAFDWNKASDHGLYGGVNQAVNDFHTAMQSFHMNFMQIQGGAAALESIARTHQSNEATAKKIDLFAAIAQLLAGGARLGYSGYKWYTAADDVVDAGASALGATDDVVAGADNAAAGAGQTGSAAGALDEGATVIGDVSASGVTKVDDAIGGGLGAAGAGTRTAPSTAAGLLADEPQIAAWAEKAGMSMDDVQKIVDDTYGAQRGWQMEKDMEALVNIIEEIGKRQGLHKMDTALQGNIENILSNVEIALGKLEKTIAAADDPAAAALKADELLEGGLGATDDFAEVMRAAEAAGGTEKFLEYLSKVYDVHGYDEGIEIVFTPERLALLNALLKSDGSVKALVRSLGPVRAAGALTLTRAAQTGYRVGNLGDSNNTGGGNLGSSGLAEQVVADSAFIESQGGLNYMMDNFGVVGDLNRKGVLRTIRDDLLGIFLLGPGETANRYFSTLAFTDAQQDLMKDYRVNIDGISAAYAQAVTALERLQGVLEAANLDDPDSTLNQGPNKLQELLNRLDRLANSADSSWICRNGAQVSNTRNHIAQKKRDLETAIANLTALADKLPRILQSLQSMGQGRYGLDLFNPAIFVRLAALGGFLNGQRAAALGQVTGPLLKVTGAPGSQAAQVAANDPQVELVTGPECITDCTAGNNGALVDYYTSGSGDYSCSESDNFLYYPLGFASDDADVCDHTPANENLVFLPFPAAAFSPTDSAANGGSNVAANGGGNGGSPASTHGGSPATIPSSVDATGGNSGSAPAEAGGVFFPTGPLDNSLDLSGSGSIDPSRGDSTNAGHGGEGGSIHVDDILEPGTYFIAVDGFADDGGDYNLDIDTCDNGGDNGTCTDQGENGSDDEQDGEDPRDTRPPGFVPNVVLTIKMSQSDLGEDPGGPQVGSLVKFIDLPAVDLPAQGTARNDTGYNADPLSGVTDENGEASIALSGDLEQGADEDWYAFELGVTSDPDIDSLVLETPTDTNGDPNLAVGDCGQYSCLTSPTCYTGAADCSDYTPTPSQANGGGCAVGSAGCGVSTPYQANGGDCEIGTAGCGTTTPYSGGNGNMCDDNSGYCLSDFGDCNAGGYPCVAQQFGIGDQNYLTVNALPSQLAGVEQFFVSLPFAINIQVNICRGKLEVPAEPMFLNDGSPGSWEQNYPDQWALRQVGLGPEARDAWKAIGKGEPVTVAVVDTGLDWHHREINWDNLWYNTGEIRDNRVDDDGNGYTDDIIGWNFFAHTNQPVDNDGHGTMTAGIIAAAHNGEGMAGMNPNVRIMVLKAINNFGNTRASYIAEAIVYAADNGARVINLSVGGKEISEIEMTAIDYALEKGALLVVASGNSNINTETFGIAAHPGVLTVGATEWNNKRAFFSNWGNEVDIAAPGMDVLGLRARRTDTMRHIEGNDYTPGDAYVGADRRYYRASGTSFAAPFVAGAASLLFATRPELTAAQVKRILEQSATDIESPGFDRYTGHGLLNVPRALDTDRDYFIDAAISAVAVAQGDKGPVLLVNGTANADRFRTAYVEIGPGKEPDKWQRATDKLKKAVLNGQLGEIDANLLRTAPEWTLKLVVEHKDGSRREFLYVLELG